MEAAVWGFVGTLIGALVSLGGTWLNARTTYSLHLLQAREELLERRREFQRKTLLELQEALHDAIRLTSRAHTEDMRAEKNGEKWGSNRLDEELSEQLRLSQRKVFILADRIEHEKVRTNVKGVLKALGDIVMASKPNEAQSKMADLFLRIESIFEQMGIVLRGYY